ncbi:MAG TPA: bifunctional 3-(3-hydroxy-phenyl)propionate/3-hydroxycinnamic acid hydroxylase [Baekduia sp.]|nr:bifunctional 3-(3-hydroxy-phenyl)propionate/3-hydroxycinnamic acid hydroxylase [Baekduia sp.]
MPHSCERYDVVQVGYGPAGQALTALLAQRGHRVAALERYPSLYNLPRAGHIDHEAVRLVQLVGDAQSLVDTMWEVDEEYCWLNQHGAVLMTQPAPEHGPASSGWFADYTMWQPNLENALHAAALAHGADVLLGWEVVEIENAHDAVRLCVAAVELDDRGRRRHTGERRELEASYVVAADGASSFTREALGIARDDLGFNERWLDVDLHTLQDIPITPNLAQICDPGRPRLVMPLGRSHRRFEWLLFGDETDAEFERPETAWKLLEEFGVTPRTHEIARQIIYTFQARIAERWRCGRILLAGDAAHTMPPFAGQGALSALRDAANAAWKLDLVLRGAAPDALLDTYQLEREPHVREWTRISMHEGAISCETDPARAAERDARMLAGERIPIPEFPKLRAGVLQGGTRAPIAGMLAPQGRVRVGGREGLFDDVAGGPGFALLALGTDPREHLRTDQVAFLEELGANVAGLAAPEEAGPGALVDSHGDYAAFFTAHGVAAILARPDFYVFGAVADLAELEALVDDLAAQLQDPPRPRTPEHTHAHRHL